MIKYPERFNQAAPAGFDGVFDWDFLRGAFGPTIAPMDFDGVIERRGHFLVFETKAEGVPIPTGQKITLEALCRTRLFTVFIQYGKTPETISSLVIWRGRKRETYDPADARTVYDRAAAWFQFATASPYPTAQEDVREIIERLRDENGDLRERLKTAHSKIDILTDQLDYIRQNFKLQQPAPKKRKPTATVQQMLFPVRGD